MLDVFSDQNVDRNRRPVLRQAQSKAQVDPEDRAVSVLSALALYSCPESSTFSKDLAHHTAFARLYFYSTKRWLRHLEDTSDPRIIYLLIAHFFELYERHVTQVVTGRDSRMTRHWRPYLRRASKLRADKSYLQKLHLTFLGARAHVRYDLADAIVAACQSHRDIYGEYPDMESFRKTLLSPETDRVFFGAARDFADEAHPDTTDAPKLLLLSLTIRLQALWLPVFQHWRRAAWTDAVSWLQNDAPSASSQLYSQRYH